VLIAAIDQGTTSTRCILFDRAGQVRAIAQQEHRQIYPQPGWVEHDPMEIWARAQQVLTQALDSAGLRPADIAAIGITNQRETTVIWERQTGQPIANAIVWQDTRTAGLCTELARVGGQDRYRQRTGLPLATYFSGPKIKWLLDNVPGARRRAQNGELLFGTIDTWLIWNATGQHVTDVTNASRTLLMNLETLDWDDDILAELDIPRAILPRIVSSSETYGRTRDGIPIRRRHGRSTSSAVRPGVFRARRGEEHLWHGLLSVDEHRLGAGSFPKRPADHAGLQAGRRPASLCPGRVNCRHRRPGAMVAR
jgi:glycerol kinase